MSRSTRSIANFTSSQLLQVLSIGIGMVSTPLLLHWLGDERFGAFRSVSDWMAYLNLLHLGLGGAFSSMLAIAIGQGDRDTVRRTFAVAIQAYFKAMLIMGATGVLLALVITQLVPVNRVLIQELQIGCGIGIVSILLVPLVPFQLLTDASQRSYFTNGVLMIQNFAIIGLSLGLARAGLGIPGQFLAAFLGNLIFALLIVWQSLWHNPDLLSTLTLSSNSTTWTIEQRLKQLNVPTLIVNLAGYLGLWTDNVIIAYFLGPIAVVPFVITQRLSGLVKAQVQNISNSTWAALADLYAKGETSRFNQQLLGLTRICTLWGLILMIPVAVYNERFVQLWVGAERFAGWGVNGLAAVNGVLIGILSLWAWCFTATGNVARLAPISIVSAVINLLITLGITPIIGAPGPLIGTFISFILNLFWIPPLLHQQFGISPTQLLKTLFLPWTIALPYTLVMVAISHLYPPAHWLDLGIAVVMTMASFIGLIWMLLLSPLERQQWGDYCRQFRRRFSPGA
jgi:O-antigen/teichoic acid export membrane protein